MTLLVLFAGAGLAPPPGPTAPAAPYFVADVPAARYRAGRRSARLRAASAPADLAADSPPATYRATRRSRTYRARRRG